MYYHLNLRNAVCVSIFLNNIINRSQAEVKFVLSLVRKTSKIHSLSILGSYGTADNVETLLEAIILKVN